MTKAEMQAELDQLRAQNAALRDLIAAVQETAQAGKDAPFGEGAWTWIAGHRAAQRIAGWLEGLGPGADDLTRTADMFRRHVGEIPAAVAGHEARPASAVA